MMSEIFVECRGMSVGYHEPSSASVVVKKDLTLRAYGGEMVALIGQNGIGKSTLLKTIAGFQPPLSGDLLINNRLVADYSSSQFARKMSFVPTGIVRVANLTVRELVGLGRFPHTNWFGQLGEKDHQIVSESIRLVGLSGYEERAFNRISDGERQKAMIARALAQDTGIIVLDEPTAFLDISNKYEIVQILHKLAEEQGKCILFSTHDLGMALSTADHIWLMFKEVVVEGLPEEMVFKGYFESLFPGNPHLLFDPGKGDFRIRRESRGVIALDADGAELTKATKALERLGFEVISPSPLHPLSLSKKDAHVGAPLRKHPRSPFSLLPSPFSGFLVSHSPTGWTLKTPHQTLEAGSLENLCRVIKRITLQQQS